MKGDFWTMKEVGQAFDTSRHKVGKKLKELGLQTEAGKPSRKAFEAGLCEQRFTEEGLNYLWAWHGSETVRLLQACGFGKKEAKGQDQSASS